MDKPDKARSCGTGRQYYGAFSRGRLYGAQRYVNGGAVCNGQRGAFDAVGNRAGKGPVFVWREVKSISDPRREKDRCGERVSESADRLGRTVFEG